MWRKVDYMDGLGMRFDIKPESVFFIGITGGSCAGKTEFAKRLQAALGCQFCNILNQDSYYLDQSAIFRGDGSVNFDAPESIDFELLYQHLLKLQQNEPIPVPVYDFNAHKRLSEIRMLFSADIILLEGELILTQPEIRKLLTECVFIDVPEKVRLARRLQRDIWERGRQREGVLHQFNRHVQPMHQRFIEPTKKLATYVVSNDFTAGEVIADIVDKLGIDS
jgi:uridine kinase